MRSEKIMKPLDELVGYIDSIPLIIEPFPSTPVNTILSEIKRINGKVNNVFYRNNIEVEIKLEHISFIATKKYIKKIKFNGNLNLLKGLPFKKNSIIDIYLEEVLGLSEMTPVIIHTFEALNADNKKYLNSICKKLQEYPRIKNSYTANMPLRKIEIITNIPNISCIQYNKRVIGKNTTKTFLPSTFW
jgi:hypothetical protein